MACVMPPTTCCSRLARRALDFKLFIVMTQAGPGLSLRVPRGGVAQVMNLLPFLQASPFKLIRYNPASQADHPHVT